MPRGLPMPNGTASANQTALACEHFRSGNTMASLRTTLLGTDASGGAAHCGDAGAVSTLASAVPLVTTTPIVDHHQHLLSPQGAALLNALEQAKDVPAPITALLARKKPRGTMPKPWRRCMARTRSPGESRSGLVVTPRISRRISRGVRQPYRIVPLAWHGDDQQGYLSAMYSRGEGVERKERRHRGECSSCASGSEGDPRWLADRDATSACSRAPRWNSRWIAERLVELLDAAGIRRAVVLSVGYWFQSPDYRGRRSGARRARGERWTADQAARYPDRLIAFCSLDPVSDAALGLRKECVDDGRFKGLKLHFGNNNGRSRRSRAGRTRARRVRGRQRRTALAIVVHARNNDGYGAREAHIVIDELLPAAPDVTVQMAHLWGGGAFAPEALAVYAEAVAAKHPATRRSSFSTRAISRIRRDLSRTIRTDRPAHAPDRTGRIVYGSDGAFEGHPDAKASWLSFRKALPLTDDEFATIAANTRRISNHDRAASCGRDR